MMGRVCPQQVCQIHKAEMNGRYDRGSYCNPDLNKMQKWADRSLMKFRKWKYKVMPMGKFDPMHQYMLGVTWLESNFAEKVLGVQVDTKLTTSQQCVLAQRRLMVS